MSNVIKDGRHSYGDLCYVSSDVSMCRYIDVSYLVGFISNKLFTQEVTFNKNRHQILLKLP
jgi:hypothetical protein